MLLFTQSNSLTYIALPVAYIYRKRDSVWNKDYIA